MYKRYKCYDFTRNLGQNWLLKSKWLNPFSKKLTSVVLVSNLNINFYKKKVLNLLTTIDSTYLRPHCTQTSLVLFSLDQGSRQLGEHKMSNKLSAMEAKASGEHFRNLNLLLLYCYS